MKILGIDTGTERSGLVIWDSESKEILWYSSEMILKEKTWNNERFLHDLTFILAIGIDQVAIEMVSCMGMPVGDSVFETVLWIGEFRRAFKVLNIPIQLIKRNEVKINMCGSMRAKDSNIRQVLIDRFGSPGTKKKPGKTYGISGHLWQALAVAVTFYDIK